MFENHKDGNHIVLLKKMEAHVDSCFILVGTWDCQTEISLNFPNMFGSSTQPKHSVR